MLGAKVLQEGSEISDGGGRGGATMPAKETADVKAT